LPPRLSSPTTLLFPAHIVKVSKDAAVAHFEEEEEEARTNRSSTHSIMALV
jgi:hypothetical protein